MGVRAAEQVKSVREYVEHGGEGLDSAAWASGQVEHEGTPNRAGHSAREPSERTRATHRFGEPRSLALKYEARPLRRLVTRRESCSAGADDQATKVARQFAQCCGDMGGTVRHRRDLVDSETCVREHFDERHPTSIRGDSFGDGVRNGEDASSMGH